MKTIKNIATAWKCVKCHGLMTFGTKMHSHGICPHCGHDSHSTVIDADAVIDKVEITTVFGVPIYSRRLT